MNKLITILTNEIKLFFKIQKSEREWHIPFLASFCTAVPLFLGLYLIKSHMEVLLVCLHLLFYIFQINLYLSK